MANGIYTNSELIGTILDDLNRCVKALLIGQSLQACVILTGITQKLTNLRQNIENDIKNRDEIIESLKSELRKRGVEIVEKEISNE